jgi:hypothetical protein
MGWVNLIDLVRANPPTQKEIEQVLEYRRKRAKARFYPTLFVNADLAMNFLSLRKDARREKNLVERKD